MRSLSNSMLVAAVLTAIGATAAKAQTIYLEYSNIVATGPNIFLNRLPIKTPNGIIYKNVTIQLRSDSNGLVSDVSPILQIVSPPVLSANFRAGTYVLPGSPSFGFVLTGPGVIPGSAMSKWAVNETSKLAGVCGLPAVFYVGPLNQNPYYATRLKPALISNPEYSYGIVGSPSECTSDTWGTNAIVGFSQTGALLTIASFTDNSSKDHNVPVEIRTYQLPLP